MTTVYNSLLDINGEAQGDKSGTSVSINGDGTIVAIGAPNNDGNGTHSGHVRVFGFNGLAWIQLGDDIDGESVNDNSGYSISLTPDGKFLAIGATDNNGPGPNTGHVRVFEYNGIDTWNQVGSDIDGTDNNDQTGFSVAINTDGTIVVIGSPYVDDGGNNSGQVRVFQYNGTAWIQYGTSIDGDGVGDNNGYSVAINDVGDIIAMGAPQNTNASGTNSGQVRVFQYITSDWVQLGSDLDGQNDQDQNGYSVSLNSSGTIVASGAIRNDNANGSNAGCTKVLEYDAIGTVWNQLGSDILGKKVGDESGTSISLSDSGYRIAVGAPNNSDVDTNTGHLRLFEYADSVWTEIKGDIDGQSASDQSGSSVSINSDGTVVAVGSPANDVTASEAGQVRVFQCVGDAWTQNLTINMCLRADTNITTDQGNVQISLINPLIHTINGHKILEIVKSKLTDNEIICIQTHAFGENIPNCSTYVSKNHKILWNGKLIKAYKMNRHGILHGLDRIPYNGEIMYNVLLDSKYSTMLANNMTVETQHPPNDGWRWKRKRKKIIN
jgi:hypothetical protein